MNGLVTRVLGFGMVLALLLSVVSCVVPEGQTVSAERDAVSVDEDGSTGVDQALVDTAQDALPLSTLDVQEIEGILYMRDEEKLAHDVYTVLYDLWGLPIFRNIAESEATHTEAVRVLLERYDLPDPAATTEQSVYNDPTLQALYDELVAEGSESLESAIRVGAAIEEIDILVLQDRIAQTDEGDIILVYENLMQGSLNHLRSFVSTLNRQTGAPHSPQYLETSTYEDING